MKTTTIIVFLFCLNLLQSQNTITGVVNDPKDRPISGANVFIQGTYDGATTDENGRFNFTTEATGSQFLVVSFISYESVSVTIYVGAAANLQIKLKESINALEAVVITAGTFEAGDKARVSVLKPLDIVTTAGSAGDIVAALLTLPGTQTVGEDGRLFVRGGEADETQTFIDGLRVAQPYGATTNNLPTRGRFSPFLFSGISFSTGGYSAEYGGALSGVLLLNTQDDPIQDKTDISLMTVGLGVGHTKKWDNSSLSVNASYVDLAPYQAAVPQLVDWSRPFQSLSGESVYRRKFKNGTFKIYTAFDTSRFDINQEDINANEKIRVNLSNNNFYLNTSFKGYIFNHWQLLAGVGYGIGNNDITLDLDEVTNVEKAAHLKLKLARKYNRNLKLSFGADHFITNFDEQFANALTFFPMAYSSNITAVYTEADLLFSNRFAVKSGVRATYDNLLQETSIAPRISLAYKTGRDSQFSLAYGDFYQAPSQGYLKFNPDGIGNEKATHYILNYQHTRERQLFRAEMYRKDYSRLVRFNTPTFQYGSNLTNDGYGFAHGLDIFWRDGKSFKNLEYWVSYSFIDTERLYRNYRNEATPSFAASHSLSIVGKYWINQWRSQLSVTNSFSSGRPYNDPNQMDFMNRRTRAYNNLSLSWAYLVSQQKILYLSVSNVLGTKNVFGYEYANTPNLNGFFERREIGQTADRFIFIGFFWTISGDKTSNQLENL